MATFQYLLMSLYLPKLWVKANGICNDNNILRSSESYKGYKKILRQFVFILLFSYTGCLPCAQTRKNTNANNAKQTYQPKVQAAPTKDQTVEYLNAELSGVVGRIKCFNETGHMYAVISYTIDKVTLSDSLLKINYKLNYIRYTNDTIDPHMEWNSTHECIIELPGIEALGADAAPPVTNMSDDDGYKYKYEGGNFMLRTILKKKTIIDIAGSQEDIDRTNEFRIWCDEKNRPKIIKAFDHLRKLFSAPDQLTF